MVHTMAETESEYSNAWLIERISKVWLGRGNIIK